MIVSLAADRDSLFDLAVQIRARQDIVSISEERSGILARLLDSRLVKHRMVLMVPQRRGRLLETCFEVTVV